MIYQFAFHKNVSKEAPNHFTFQWHKRLANGEKLSRKEKDDLAASLYGTFSQGSATYKLMGWAVSFRDVLPKYLVQYDWENVWREYWTPDKTSLRKALSHLGKIEIIEFPTKKGGKKCQ